MPDGAASLIPDAANGDDALVISRLAIQLSREFAGRYLSLDELAGDACVMIRLARKSRISATTGTRPGPDSLRKLQSLAVKYGAVLIVPADDLGMHVGLRFSSGCYTAGFRNMYFLA